MAFKPLKAVYSFIFPEVWQSIHSVDFSPEFFRTQTNARQLAQQFQDIDTLPENKEGQFDTERLYEIVHATILKSYSCLIPSLSKYKHFYPTSGSSEGLFHILTDLKLKGVRQINVLAGEYEGFGIQAGNLGLKVKIVPLADTLTQKPGWWIVSQPTARNGAILPASWFKDMAKAGHKFVVDYAYVGLTYPTQFAFGGYVPEYAVMSLSKPYGVFALRIGFTFSKQVIPSLIGNKLWFRDNTRQIQACAIINQVGPLVLKGRYAEMQEAIVSGMREETQLPIELSESLLLAYLPTTVKLSTKQTMLLSQFKRYDNYRFCLTPYFEDLCVTL